MKKFKYSEITPEYIYKNRRKFIKNLGLAAGSMLLNQHLITSANASTKKENMKLTEYRYITTYNNYYEFGTGKSDPVERSQKFKTKPWDITIDGEVENPITISMEEIMEMFPSEERIYKLRCVEGWSMVIPWNGFPLSKILKKVSPTNKAKFVKFTSVLDPEQMIGQRFPILDWPYKEGLRIDEAMHDLTILVTGLYGKKLPNQNGAPLRLMVPWKYGFKSSKAIVNIKLVEKMPTSSWMKASPKEYGFYSNVNPKVDHPRWSQATERVIGEGIISPRIPTTMFNGYGDEVANLYTGMDLKKIFLMKSFLKPSIFTLGLIPFIIITYKIFLNKLGPEPVKEITHFTGEWTLIFICLTLSMSPLKRFTNFKFWIKIRRMLGLFVFFYATLHLLTYIVIDYRLDWSQIIDDVVKKKYIFVGFAAWLLLIPLVLTSSKRMIILLKKNWNKLHKLIYVIAIFGSLHFIWLSKTIFFKPLIYSSIILLLLILRIRLKKTI